MNVSIKTAAFEIVVADNFGNVVFSHKADNLATTLDVGCGMAMISALAHQFKQLDATHNVRSAPVAPVGVFDRPHEVQVAIDALRKYRRAIDEVDMSDEQHEASMAMYAALRNVRDDASTANIAVFKAAAHELLGSFCELGDKLPARTISAAAGLTAALAAL